MRVALILLMLLTQTGLAAGVEVRGVRVWAGPEYTRAVFDVSAKADYKLFSLEGPDRLVLDIDKGDISKVALPAGTGLVKGMRSGRPGDGQLRLVFDLSEKARAKSFLLAPAENYGHRLVVDLYPELSSKPAPVLRADNPPDSKDLRKVIVAIDAGHGGEDPGALGASGTREKDVVLAISRALAKQVNAEPGMQALLIRDGDYYVAHRQRFMKAREAKADIFISIHADAFHKQTANGSSVFILSPTTASNEAASWLAERENRSDLVGGVSLDSRDDTLAAVLLDLSQGATMEASSEAAGRVHASLKRLGKTHKNQVEKANFYVLRSPDVPSMLVETAFISNPTEERRLKDPKHQQALASAILDGVRDYFHSRPPPGTWIAAHAQPRSHIVSSGETLSAIAEQHRVSLESLRQANAKRGDVVKVGEVLRIPTSS